MYSIKYLFDNLEKSITIIEIILKNNLPKDERCFWLYIDTKSNIIKKIPFISKYINPNNKNNSIIQFTGGKIIITDDSGFFNYERSYIKLDRLNNKLKLLPEIEKLINDLL